MKGAHRGGEGRDEDGSPARGGKAGKGMFKRWKRSSSKSIDILNSEPGSEDFEANDDNAERERVGEDSLADFGNRMNDSATSLPEGQDWMRATSLQFSIRSSLNSQHPPSAAAVEAENTNVEGGSIEELYSSQPTLETTPEDLETPIPDPKKCVQEALLMSSGSSSEEISPVCVDQFPTVHNNINNSRPDENSSPESGANDNDNEDGEEDDTPPQSGNNKRASISTYFDPTVGVMPLPFSDMDDLDDSSPESTRFMDFYRDQPPPDHAHHRVHRQQQRPPLPAPPQLTTTTRRPTAFEREQSRRQFQATQQARHNDNPIKEQQQQMQTQQPIITAEVTVAGQPPAPPSPTDKDTTRPIPSDAEPASVSTNSRPTAAASPPQSPPGTNPRNSDKKSKGYNRYGMAGLLEKHKHKHIRRASEPAAKQTTSPSPSPNKGRRNSLAAAVQQGIMNQIRGGGGTTRQQHNHHQVRRNSANQVVQDDPAMDHSDPRAHMTTTKTTKVESSSSERESASSSSSSYELVRDHSSTSDLGCSSQQHQVSQELHASDSSSLYHDGRSPSTRNISVDNTIDNDAKPTMPARRTESEGSEETVQTCPSRSSYSYVKGLPFTKDPSSSSLQQEPPQQQQQLPPQQPQPPYAREPADHYIRRDPAVLTYGTPYTSRGPRVMPTPSTVSMASEETEITAPSRTHAFRLHEEASNSRTSHSPPQSDFNGTVVIPGSRTASGRIPAPQQHYSGAPNNNNAHGNPTPSQPQITQVNYHHQQQQHPRASPPLPAPTTTTTSAAPPPPVVANSHRLPDSMPPQRQRSNLMQRPPPPQVPGPDETIFIHVKPDLKVPLRRVPDVCQALAKNYYDTPNCPSCNQQIAVVADAAFIYCPRCHEINPVFGNIWPVGDFPEEPEYHRFGLGLGMTWDTMKKVFQELFPEEYANDHHQHPTATSTSS